MVKNPPVNARDKNVGSGEKVSSTKLVSGAKKVGDHCLKGLGLFFFPLFSLIQLIQLSFIKLKDDFMLRLEK